MSLRDQIILDHDQTISPVAVLWGDKDPISPVEVGEEFQRRMRDANLVVMSGGTHALALERPDEVAALVLQHLIR